MKPNPGGQVAPGNVIGRDSLIERIWDRLDVQSLLLTAERRVGKTSILKKMTAEPRGNWKPIYQDLEKIATANEFAVDFVEKAEGLVSGWHRHLRLTRGLLEKLGGAEVAGVVAVPRLERHSWKKLLSQLVDELLEHQHPNRIVFFWDEFPWMIEKIRDNEGDGAARDLMDQLRELRQTRPDFRVVLTGSVGLHHVLDGLRRRGYGNEPVNDMGPPVPVPPLEPDHARNLTRMLIEGSGIETDQPEKAARLVASETGGVPYYIHAIVDALATPGPRIVKEADIRRTVRSMLTSPEDPWNLRHYLDRIPRYFGESEEWVLLVLDELATRGDGASTEELLGVIARQSSNVPRRERLRDLLRLLALDHYLEKTDDNRYRFQFPILKRWWALERELKVVE